MSIGIFLPFPFFTFSFFVFSLWYDFLSLKFIFQLYFTYDIILYSGIQHSD